MQKISNFDALSKMTKKSRCHSCTEIFNANPPSLPGSWIRNQSPGLSYGSPNLLDKIYFWAFLCFSLEFNLFPPKIQIIFRFIVQFKFKFRLNFLHVFVIVKIVIIFSLK